LEDTDYFLEASQSIGLVFIATNGFNSFYWKSLRYSQGIAVAKQTIDPMHCVSHLK